MDQDAGKRLAQLLLHGGVVQKMVRQKLAFEVENKNVMKRVAVRALNFPTIPFCMKFRGESNREGPEGHNGQKLTKNDKKVLRILH